LKDDRKYPLPEISNPNLQSQGPRGGGGGGDMRSTLLFTMLILAVVLGYQYFMKPSGQQQQQQNQTQQSQQAQPAAQTSAPAQVAAVAGQASGQTTVPMPAIQAALETQTTVENPVFKIVFTNRGAQVKHWILKAYKDSDGRPLDMVQPQVAAKVGYPLSLYTYEPALTDQLNQALYQVTTEGSPLATTGAVQAPTSLTFHYEANGLDVVKTFRFDKSYVIGVETRVTRNGSPVRALVEWPGGLGDMEEFLPSSANRSPVRTSASSMFAWSLNGKQDSLAAHKVGGYATLNEAYSYAAVSDLYFATAFLPSNPEQVSVMTLHNTIELPSDLSDPNSKKTPADVIGLAVGDQSGTTKLRLFAGPKATELLSSIHAIGADGKQTGQSLDPLIQLGWLTVIAKPLYLVLRFFYEHGVPNWGWAIIIVTVLFNLALLYTRISMMKSSLKMMRIQPKVEAIKKRYAHLKMNDPKRAEMNQETMALYKTEGVNMYGSCLPMLLQMPLFFAYYKVLANAVELRQAQWYWLKDLSSPDPLYILPIVIIGSMFLVQILTPSPGMDPAQRKMMAFLMPAIFGFSMLHFASGLALYWATGNLIMLALQLAINKSSIGREMHELAARRASKKTGSAKTIQGRR
jgi:YidC/Oxa1 family membrane protein insertase